MDQKTNGLIKSSAPVRVNDLGGWTDTWFSGRGRVLSIAVSPGARCHLKFTWSRAPNRDRFTLDVRNFSERYSFDPDNPPLERHPLLEAAVASMKVPGDVAVEASVWSDVPPGCGTGTSASVAVALIGALDCLRGGRMDLGSMWRMAHSVETEKLGWESGIQDQICAAYGGICYVDIRKYPEARVTRLELKEAAVAALDDRLALVYLGKRHKSSDVHREVIEKLARKGNGSAHLDRMRQIPLEARSALEKGDLERYGKLMIENTEYQRGLHPALVSGGADQVIELAKNLGASGWKVNGAGGKGGSVTILMGDDPGAKTEYSNRLPALGSGFRIIPLKIDHEGLRAERK